MYGMGDALFDRLEIQAKDAFKYREVARQEFSVNILIGRHYLYGGAMETAYFTSKTKIPRSFYTVIKRLMTSLHQSKGT